MDLLQVFAHCLVRQGLLSEPPLSPYECQTLDIPLGEEKKQSHPTIPYGFSWHLSCLFLSLSFFQEISTELKENSFSQRHRTIFDLIYSR